jgi:uncharacterized BrkB/YihY/UPF0761 family membrane protein
VAAPNKLLQPTLGITTMNVITKQTLLGPAVVGLVVGFLAGLAVLGFELEYGSNIHPHQQPVWLYASLQAALAFVLVLVCIVAVFGVVPALMRKASSK